MTKNVSPSFHYCNYSNFTIITKTVVQKKSNKPKMQKIKYLGLMRVREITKNDFSKD